MSKFHTIGFIFFTIVNFVSILILYQHYRNSIFATKSLNSVKNGNVKRQHESVTIKTLQGSYIGFVQKFNNKRIKTFLSIPYAIPPKDEYRFKHPHPFQLNGASIQTDRWPKPCLQPDNHLRLKNHDFSEDCLYLNVWSPNETQELSLPVLVVIHTGAFLFGSASEVTYNGLALSQLSNTVVVTFNYRLNLFGFYYNPDENITSNVGMLDQVLLLRWVQQNIRHFGGDPSRITLIGQVS